VQRFVLFVFFVVLVPVGVYWSSHGFENPAGGVQRWSAEMRALRGRRPTPAPEAAPQEPPERPAEKPAEAEPPPPPEPEAPANPSRRAEELFLAGRFAEAVEAFPGVDERKRSLAQLGAAFSRAYPPRVPRGDYLIVTTRTGDSFEGFAQAREGRIVLTLPGGQRSSFPAQAIAARKQLTREQALDRLEERVRMEGGSATIKGPRLFALIRMACVAGRPAAVAPLLARALELDDAKAYFLSAVRNQVPAEYQSDLFRAFMACELPRIPEATEEVVTNVHTPRQLGGLHRAKGRKPRSAAQKLKPEALRLMQEAAPLKVKAIRLYRKIVVQGIDDTDAETVDEALRVFDQAIALYEKALEVDESDIIYSVLTPCSRYRAQLSFWQTVKQGR